MDRNLEEKDSSKGRKLEITTKFEGGIKSFSFLDKRFPLLNFSSIYLVCYIYIYFTFTNFLKNKLKNV